MYNKHSRNSLTIETAVKLQTRGWKMEFLFRSVQKRRGSLQQPVRLVNLVLLGQDGGWSGLERLMSMAPGRGSSRKKKTKRKAGMAAYRAQRVCGAISDITAWACVARAPLPQALCKRGGGQDPPLFDLHTHSTCSDGRLLPADLVARAHKHGVQVLALTDHDTMAGLPEAMEAAQRYGMRIVPGVEISATYQVSGESVHILAYYGPCGPARIRELDSTLLRIREGRFLRAQSMVQKLQALHKPIRWERVLELAGEGVAPGRPHVARALLEAGHVDTEQQAFVKYLHDGGPAYAKGHELPGDEVVELIRRTGGVAVLAHPWSLKNPCEILECLKAAGLHGMEVYRRDGKAGGFAQLCDLHQLLKLGGSDFHGRGDPTETELGGVSLPAPVLDQFLGTAQPIWRVAFRDILQDFANEKPEGCGGLHNPTIFGLANCKGLGVITLRNSAGSTLRLAPSLTEEERAWLVAEAALLALSHVVEDEQT